MSHTHPLWHAANLLHDAHSNQEESMLDAIEMLETIGSDASLRHASSEKLGEVLQQAQASEAFKAAVMSGDSSRLSGELGFWPLDPPQSSQTIVDGFFDTENASV
jgi:hypothetical protein